MSSKSRFRAVLPLGKIIYDMEVAKVCKILDVCPCNKGRDPLTDLPALSFYLKRLRKNSFKFCF